MLIYRLRSLSFSALARFFYYCTLKLFYTNFLSYIYAANMHWCHGFSNSCLLFYIILFTGLRIIFESATMEMWCILGRATHWHYTDDELDEQAVKKNKDKRRRIYPQMFSDLYEPDFTIFLWYIYFLLWSRPYQKPRDTRKTETHKKWKYTVKAGTTWLCLSSEPRFCMEHMSTVALLSTPRLLYTIYTIRERQEEEEVALSLERERASLFLYLCILPAHIRTESRSTSSASTHGFTFDSFFLSSWFVNSSALFLNLRAVFFFCGRISKLDRTYANSQRE